MPKPFDATMRGLIELEPAAWLRFLRIPISEPSRVKVIDSNISTVSAEADKVLWIDDPEPWVEHIELQASRDATLPDRVLWYSTIMRRGLSVPVHSTIILLRPAADGPELTGVLEHRNRRRDVYHWFRYDVVRLWTRNVDDLLTAGLPVLPLAPVAAVEAEQVPGVLVAISNRLQQEATADLAATLWNATRVLLGLRYPEAQIDAMIEGVANMLFGINGIEESTVYQGILKKGEAQGEARGRARGMDEGLLQEARSSVLRLGRKKLGPPHGRVEAELAAIQELDRLHDLQYRILDATTWDDLLPPSAP